MKFSRIISIFVTVVATVVFFAIHSQAKVNCKNLTEEGALLSTAELHIFDEITANDPSLVEKCIEKHPRLLQPYLNSPGGDVYAAMEIGRLLRINRRNALVTPQSQCMSSCVLILAGAVSRSSFGTIGIHRPYSTETGIIKFEEAQNQYQKTRSDIERYLREMNIPTSLFAAMERIPPEKIKILTAQEIKEFGLNDTDPVEQEVRNAYRADQRGISIQEYFRRIDEAERICHINWTTAKTTDIQDFHDCKEAVSWGLTTSVYRSRIIKRSVCKKVEMKYGFFSKEKNSCLREVMTGAR